MISRRPGLIPLLLIALAGPSISADDFLAALPVLPKPKPQPAIPAEAGELLAPGVTVIRGKALRLTGRINLDQGPTDGMEVLVCLREGKTHEALIRLEATSGVTVKAGLLAAFGPPDGQPAPEGKGQPARGVPVQVTVEWLDRPGYRVQVAASNLVRDRVTDCPFPALPWVVTGSRFETIRFANADGSVQEREQFMLDSTRSVAVNFDEPDALLASPFPIANNDQRFEANSALCPLAGTEVVVTVAPCPLPLTLDLDANGQLLHETKPLDDAGLGALLAQHYGTTASPLVRAVGVRVDADLPHRIDVAARSQILTAAAAAKAWVVPVFQLR